MKAKEVSSGDTAEALFMAIALKRNCIVSKPFSHDSPYDFITDSGGGLKRIQVKSSHLYTDNVGRNYYHYALSVGADKAENTQVDVYAFRTDDGWYVIPYETLKGKLRLKIYPKGKKYLSFKNKFNIL